MENNKHMEQAEKRIQVGRLSEIYEDITNVESIKFDTVVSGCGMIADIVRINYRNRTVEVLDVTGLSIPEILAQVATQLTDATADNFARRFTV